MCTITSSDKITSLCKHLSNLVLQLAYKLAKGRCATSWFQLFNLYLSLLSLFCCIPSLIKPFFSQNTFLTTWITFLWKLDLQTLAFLGQRWQFFPRLLSIGREACHVAKIIQKQGHPNYEDPLIYEIGEKFPTQTIWP